MPNGKVQKFSNKFDFIIKVCFDEGRSAFKQAFNEVNKLFI